MLTQPSIVYGRAANYSFNFYSKLSRLIIKKDRRFPSDYRSPSIFDSLFTTWLQKTIISSNSVDQNRLINQKTRLQKKNLYKVADCSDSILRLLFARTISLRKVGTYLLIELQPSRPESDHS